MAPRGLLDATVDSQRQRAPELLLEEFGRLELADLGDPPGGEPLQRAGDCPEGLKVSHKTSSTAARTGKRTPLWGAPVGCR